MQLHRSGREPDWQARPRRRWNRWQRTAAGTGGVLTIGNVLTIIGFIAVVAGLVLIAQRQYVVGLTLVAAGRLCDLLDGWLADRTGTKSPLGETFDATADKLETAAALIILTAAGIVPWGVSLALFLAQLMISLVAMAAVRRGVRLHPSRLGKLGMASAWLALGGFVLMRIEGKMAGWWLEQICAVLIVVSVVLALYTSADYLRLIRRKRQATS